MERPVKKPRLQGPDGFQKSKPTTCYKPPESITKFVSAFDDASASPRVVVPPKKKSVSAATHERPRNPFVDFDVPKEPEAGPSKPSVLRGLLEPPLTIHHADKPLPPLKVLKPPVFLPPAVPPPTAYVGPSDKKPGTSVQPTLQRPPPHLEKIRSILKPPPVPIPTSMKPSVPLKPLVPPLSPLLLEDRPGSPKKVMKTIFTTNVAQATDPTKEGAGAELLSLFLQQHGHNFTSATDQELQRGVMVSPDKRSRGRDPKFVRGGLAERFQHRISCAKTDFALWRRQMERKLDSGSKLASDMQLRLLRVLDVVKVPERSRFTAGCPRAGLALCRLTRRHALASGDLTLGTYVVLFHFAPTQGSRSAVSTPDRFEEGNDVMAWMPWHKMELAGVEGSRGLLEMVRNLDPLTPPHSLLVVSRFCLVAPRLVHVDDAT